MINRLICKLFGHDWKVVRSDLDKTKYANIGCEYRTRCGENEALKEMVLNFKAPNIIMVEPPDSIKRLFI